MGLKYQQVISIFALPMIFACNSPSQSDLSGLVGADAASTPSASSSSASSTSSSLTPHTIQVFSGNGQTAVNGTQLSNPLTAKVIDSTGNPVSGVSVTFTSAGGNNGGVISTSQPVVTDSGGQASATVILGSTVGTQTFTASMSSGTVTSTNFTETATVPSTTLKIFAVTGNAPLGATGVTVGNTLNLRSVLVNSSGNLVTNNLGNAIEIPVTWWTTGTLAGADLTVTGGNPNVSANYSPSLTSTGTINTLVSDVALIAAYNITTTTAATGQIISTLPLNPDSISIVSGNTQTGQVGTNLSQNLVVKVVNSANAAVPGVNVTFAVQSGGGSIVSGTPVLMDGARVVSATLVTDVNGQASCTVKIGGSLGNSNSFTATMPSGSSTQVLFSASGTVGPPAQLAFTTHPSGANTGSAFSFQPVIQLRDSFGNLVNSDSTSTVTLSIESGFGAGTLSGATTVTLNSGIASFNNVAYTFGGADNTSTPIKLRATSSIGGISTATSNSFTVGQIILAAQCLANGAGWDTTDGGCKDLTNGIVWSALSSGTMNWHAAIWAAATSGSTAPEAWEVARSLTYDYTNTGVNYDANAAAYCHDLTESGYSDWRIPTATEIANSVLAGTATGLKNAGNGIWAANVTSSTVATAYNLSDGTGITGTMTLLRYARCVRQPPPTQLVVTQQIAGGVYGLAPYVRFNTQPVIQVRDSTNSTTAYATNTVTLSVKAGTGTGQLCTHQLNGKNVNCGSSVSVAAVNGVATFANVSYSKAESGVVFTASSPGLISVDLTSVNFSQTWGLAACKAVGNNWINSTGGCKDNLTGLIWSTETYNNGSSSSLNWYDTVWDQTANAGSFDASKDITTNDYDPSIALTGSLDNSTTNYCHDLKESGQDDWFMPSSSDAATLSGRLVSTYLNLTTSTGHWVFTSSSISASSTSVTSFNPATIVTTTHAKTAFDYAVCVRRDAPASIAFSVQPSYPTSCTEHNGATINSNAGTDYACNGAGTQFATMPSVIVKDAEGAGPLMYDNSVVTLEIVAASDTTGGNGRFLQYGISANNEANRVVYAKKTISTTASNGTANFTNLAYDKAGEKFRLKATATVTWHGQVYNLGPIYSNDLQTTSTHIMSRCRTLTGFSTQNGGCQDTNSGGLVWTFASPAGVVNWYSSIWDSTLSGDPKKVKTSDGVTLETAANDLDTANTDGAGTDTSVFDVCHRLYLNGYYDWRMPTYNEMNTQLATHSGINALRAPALGVTNYYIWSSKTVAGTPGSAYLMGGPLYNAGSWTAQAKNYSGGMAYCVRDPSNANSYYQYPDSP